MKKDSRILVTGASGMTGSALVRKLKEFKYTNVSPVDIFDCDLRNTGSTENIFRMIDPKYVFHVAAKVGGIKVNDNESADFIHDNLAIQNNIFEVSKKYYVKKLVFCGSACIYPKNSKSPITENSLLTGVLEETNIAYAIAKIAGVISCRAYRKQYGCNFISAMPTNLYGINDNFNLEQSHVIPALIRKIRDAKINNLPKVSIWGSGKAKREFLFADDLAEALIYLMEEYNGEMPINVGSENVISIKDLVDKIAKIIGYSGRFEYTNKLEGVKERSLNLEKIKKLGWEHKVDLDEGLKLTCDWFMDNYDKARK